MLQRYFITAIFIFSFSMAFGQLFYSDYKKIYSYNIESDKEKIIILNDNLGFKDFSQFCINSKTKEIYCSSII